MSLSPRSAQTSVMAIGLLLILFAITLLLHLKSVDPKLLISFVAVGLFLMLLAQWMMRRTNVVKVVKSYRHFGFGMMLFVLGILIIFGFITLLLMGLSYPEPILIDLASKPIQLPSINQMLPVVGVVLMLIGLWVANSGKQFIKLPE